jgi:hypothetical protein
MNRICHRARALLSESLDRALLPHEQDCLRRHLATCAACAEHERALHAGLTGIGSLPHVAGSPAVRAAVMSYVELRGRPRRLRDWISQGIKLAGAGLAVALVAVTLAAVFAGSGNSPGEGLSGAGAQPDATATAPAADPAATASPVQGPPPCIDGQVEYTTAVERNPGDPAINSPSVVNITVTALKNSGTACHLSLSMALTILDAAGRPAAIEGNPLDATLEAVLPSDDATVSFAWLNWCGEVGPFSATVEAEGAGAGAPLEAPACDDPEQPSKLGLSAEAEVRTSDGQPVTCVSGAAVLSAQVDGSGALDIWAIDSNLDGCQPPENVTIALVDDAGELLDVENNPVALATRPDDSGEFAWGGARWSNWCGAAETAVLEVKRASGSSHAEIHTTPPCEDASQPSRLTPIDEPPPDEVWPGPEGAFLPATPPADTLPACDLADLSLYLDVQRMIGDVIIDVAARAGASEDARMPVCWLEPGELTIAITDVDGVPLELDGNGAVIPISPSGRANVLPMPGIAHAFWSNWCGTDGPVTITATLGEASVTTRLDSGAECHDPNAPSTFKTTGG